MTADAPCDCEDKTASAAASASPFVYAIGQIDARPASLSVQKELAQVLGGSAGNNGTVSGLHDLLDNRDHRYLVRNMDWVLRIQGADTYLLSPADPTDFDLLVEAIRPAPEQAGMSVVIGVHAPPGTVATEAPLPRVLFEKLYSFDRASLLEPLGTDIADASVDAILRLTGNSGTTAGARALNYLAVRYSGVYTLVDEQAAADGFLSSVETVSVPDAARELVDAVFTFTKRATGVAERFAARVDVTEPFPFLVSGFVPHVMTAAR